MRCFNHHDVDAVGSCKHCGKGLCPSCLTDLGHGLACRDSHEQAVENINALVACNNRFLQRTVPKTWFIAPTFFAFMGLIFFCYGLFSDNQANPLSIAMGLGFLVYSAVTFVVNRRAFKINAQFLSDSTHHG